MQIIKEKQYEHDKEYSNLSRVSYNSNETLTLVMEDGTHYDFNGKELNKIIEFIRKLNI